MPSALSRIKRIPSSRCRVSRLAEAALSSGGEGSRAQLHQTNSRIKKTRSPAPYLGILGCSEYDIMIPHYLRRHPDAADATETTLQSAATSFSAHNGQVRSGGGASSKQRRSRSGRLWNIFKLCPTAKRRRDLTETQLQRRVKRAAEKRDWVTVRKLISNYEFSSLPQIKQTKSPPVTAFQSQIEGDLKSTRRPSYGSRSGDRLSFNGKESAAAAAAIKAAMIDERSDGSATPPDTGENILHQVCSYRPPLDVVETLLGALRHRQWASAGRDEHGRTPLHLAALTGASTDVIEALVRADPAPATMGDSDRRSPLHLAIRYLAQGGYLVPLSRSSKNQYHQVPERDEVHAQTFLTVQILKDTMLMYPGTVDFKDEDATGFAPVDYLLDSDLDDGNLTSKLIRRKRRRMSHIVTLRPTQSRRHSAESNISDDQDIEVLLRLEQEEIEARRQRIENMKSRSQHEQMNVALYDVFGIEEHLSVGPTGRAQHNCLHEVNDPRRSHLVTAPTSGDEVEDYHPHNHNTDSVSNEDDIYDQHLQDYLDDYLDEFADHNLEYCDDGDFDIMRDPEIEQSVVRLDGAGFYKSRQESREEADSADFPSEIAFVGDDDCRSILSEVTAAFSRVSS